MQGHRNLDLVKAKRSTWVVTRKLRYIPCPKDARTFVSFSPLIRLGEPRNLDVLLGTRPSRRRRIDMKLRPLATLGAPLLVMTGLDGWAARQRTKCGLNSSERRQSFLLCAQCPDGTAECRCLEV